MVQYPEEINMDDVAINSRLLAAACISGAEAQGTATVNKELVSACIVKVDGGQQPRFNQIGRRQGEIDLMQIWK